MQLFGVYVFNERMRTDRKQGDMVMIMPTTPSMVDRYGAGIAGYSKMLYMAEEVYVYDIDEGCYTTVKNRGECNGVVKHNVSLINIINARDVIFINNNIGEVHYIGDYLAGQQTPRQMFDKKYFKFSLAGLEHPELYLSALSE